MLDSVLKFVIFLTQIPYHGIMYLTKGGTYGIMRLLLVVVGFSRYLDTLLFRIYEQRTYRRTTQKEVKIRAVSETVLYRLY